MMKIVNILIIALGVVLLSACTKEPIVGGDEPLAEGTVQIKFALSDNGAAQPNTPSRAGETVEGDPTESVIYNLKVMFYNIGATDETTTLVEYLNMDLLPNPDGGPGSADDPIVGEGFSWDPATKVLTIKPAIDLKKRYKVVVIANWRDWEVGPVDPTDYRSKVKNIKALDECFTNMTAVAAQNLANGSIFAPPFVAMMSGATEHNFSVQPRATVPMIRQLVRIDVIIRYNADFRKAYPEVRFNFPGPGDDLERKPYISFYNMPNCSHILDTKGSNSKFVELLKQSGNRMFNLFSTPLWGDRDPEADYDLISRSYAYENLTFGKITDNADTRKNAPFMVIRLPYTEQHGNVTTTVTENYYKIYINDLSPAAADSPHKTVRNHLYRVNVEVNGFGGATPNDDYIRVTTEVLPWNSVWSIDQQGEFLKVDKTTIRLKHTIANSELVVKSHDREHTTVTAAGGKIKVAYDPTTGIVTLNKATYDPAINELISDYETITIKAGSLTKTVNIEYEPIVWARGDIALNADSKGSYYINGWGGHDQSLSFMFGSKVGLASTIGYPVDWNTTLPFYTPGNSSAETVTTSSGYNLAQIKAYSAATKGDPCAYVADGARKWRLPTIEEFGYLFASTPIAGDDLWGGGPFSGYRFNAFKIETSPGVYEGVFMYNYYMQRDYDGLRTLTGYYWSSTPDGANGKSLICNNVLNSGVRTNTDHWTIQAAVRCVRDFSK